MQSGPKQFADWMARRWPLSARKAREAAEYFGWDESFISQLLNGVRRPGLINAIRIERMSGIPVEAWVPSQLDNLAETLTTKARNRQSAVRLVAEGIRERGQP